MGIVVTGGTGGIGRAVLRSQSDSPVLFTYHEDGAGASELVEETDSPDGPTEAIRVDVTETDAVSSLAVRAEEYLDSVDAVVHTAGIVDPATIENLTEEQWNRVIETNLTSAYRIARAFVAPVRDAAGSLVFLSSVGGTAGTVDASYAASKAGLHGLVRALARELGPDGVQVNAIAPGPVDTEMNADILEHLESIDFRGHQNVDTHLPEYDCSPTEIAEAVDYLLDSGHVHGEILSVNGGMHLR